MFDYTLVEAIVGIVIGLLIAILTKKAEGVTYGKLDKAGIVTNIVLIPAYVVLAPMYIFLGIIASPGYDGFLGVLGWIVAVLIASTALFCSLGLGLSVALRKRGKSKLSFAAQFLGAAAILLTLLFFIVFYGNLLSPLN